MQIFVICLLILFLNILIFVDVRPVTKLEQNLLRQRRQNQVYEQNLSINNQSIISDIWNHIQPVLNDHITSHLSKSSNFGCERTTNDKSITNPGDFVEYCREKVLNQDGHSYSTKTSAILYKSDGTIIPLHQAESNIEIATYNHL